MIIKYRVQLPDLMRHLNLPLVAAELGVAEAFHSADLLRNGIEKLYAVDVWNHIPNIKGDGNSPQEWHNKNYEAAVKRLKEFGDKVVYLRGLSVNMAQHVPDNSLGLVYLDGDHSYPGVMTDLVNWYPKLINGGIISGHDLLNDYGVKQAVTDFTNDQFFIIPEDKKEDAGFYFFKKPNQC